MIHYQLWDLVACVRLPWPNGCGCTFRDVSSRNWIYQSFIAIKWITAYGRLGRRSKTKKTNRVSSSNNTNRFIRLITWCEHHDGDERPLFGGWWIYRYKVKHNSMKYYTLSRVDVESLGKTGDLSFQNEGAPVKGGADAEQRGTDILIKWWMPFGMKYCWFVPT